MTEAEAQLARRERMAVRLLILRIILALVALVSGDSAYRWADRGIQSAMEHLRDSE
ncbi:hypothetical protein [Streptomyces californicus]|uniref:hypothetical protein n=1 Tax=Streptomyces californicus TaxID=67351 RepID=UPI00367F469E